MKKCLYLSFLLLACQPNSSKKCLQLDNKKLFLKDEKVNEVLLNRKNVTQRVSINDDGIHRVEYYFSSPKIESRLNTWITLNKSGSVNYDKSNYLDHRFFSKENDPYLNLRFKTAYDPDGRYYLLYSDYDINYVSRSNIVDTVFFDMYGEAEVKLGKIHKGTNIIRVKVFSENKEINSKRMTYFEEDLFVDYE